MSEEMKKVTLESLDEVSGGRDGWVGLYDGPWKTVCNLQTGYLALRDAAYYDANNEIGELYNGESVQVIGNGTDNGYIWVYSPKLNKSGWVNASYIG